MHCKPSPVSFKRKFCCNSQISLLKRRFSKPSASYVEIRLWCITNRWKRATSDENHKSRKATSWIKLQTASADTLSKLKKNTKATQAIKSHRKPQEANKASKATEPRKQQKKQKIYPPSKSLQSTIIGEHPRLMFGKKKFISHVNFWEALNQQLRHSVSSSCVEADCARGFWKWGCHNSLEILETLMFFNVLKYVLNREPGSFIHCGRGRSNARHQT